MDRKKAVGINPIIHIKKNAFIKTILEKYDLRLLKKEIESYGYTYSFKSFLLSALGYLSVIVIISLYIKLQWKYIVFLGMVILLIIPFLIRSQFNQLYQIKRFEMVTNYLENIIPIFKRTPIITHAWSELLDLLEGEMKDVVKEAYEKIMTNTDDPEVLKSAFYIIESHFPNSRIHSLHQMMYTIVTQNTKNYVMSIDNVWLDVQSWITRVSLFQKNLKERKSKLTLLTLLTMAANCLFVMMYSSNDVFRPFTDHVIYQISSTFFMLTLIVTLCIFEMKLNGKWLLDDQTVHITKKATRSFQYITHHQLEEKIQLKDYIISFLILIVGIFVLLNKKNMAISLCCFFMAYMIFTNQKRTYKTHLKNVKKYLSIEFPSWLRDISLNINNLTVLNAIEASKEATSHILNHYIDLFLDEVYYNPTSIKPYNEFLSEFRIDGVKSTMKTLYSLQSLDKEEMDKQTNYLITRNQDLLAKAESIKNEDSISGLKLLGFVPVGIFIIQMLISMGLLFSVMIQLMNTSMMK